MSENNVRTETFIGTKNIFAKNAGHFMLDIFWTI